MRYEYKVVPAPERGEKAKGVKGADGRFANAVERIMNDMAARGWEYQRSETLPSEERSGLTQTVTVWRNLLVFRRPHPADMSSFAPRMLEPPLVLGTPVDDVTGNPVAAARAMLGRDEAEAAEAAADAVQAPEEVPEPGPAPKEEVADRPDARTHDTSVPPEATAAEPQASEQAAAAQPAEPQTAAQATPPAPAEPQISQPKATPEPAELLGPAEEGDRSPPRKRRRLRTEARVNGHGGTVLNLSRGTAQPVIDAERNGHADAGDAVGLVSSLPVPPEPDPQPMAAQDAAAPQADVPAAPTESLADMPEPETAPKPAQPAAAPLPAPGHADAAADPEATETAEDATGADTPRDLPEETAEVPAPSAAPTDAPALDTAPPETRLEQILDDLTEPEPAEAPVATPEPAPFPLRRSVSVRAARAAARQQQKAQAQANGYDDDEADDQPGAASVARALPNALMARAARLRSVKR